VRTEDDIAVNEGTVALLNVDGIVVATIHGHIRNTHICAPIVEIYQLQSSALVVLTKVANLNVVEVQLTRKSSLVALLAL